MKSKQRSTSFCKLVWVLLKRVLIGDKDYVIMDKDLLRGLSEKEVEIEHLKTTVIALN